MFGVDGEVKFTYHFRLQIRQKPSYAFGLRSVCVQGAVNSDITARIRLIPSGISSVHDSRSWDRPVDIEQVQIFAILPYTSHLHESSHKKQNCVDCSCHSLNPHRANFAHISQSQSLLTSIPQTISTEQDHKFPWLSDPNGTSSVTCKHKHPNPERTTL